MPEPLIPDDVRALYEELIDEGGRIIPADDALWHDRRVRKLLERGLATTMSFQPPMLLPAGPGAAFARTLTRWQRTMDARQRAYAEALRAAVRTARVAVWTNASRRRQASCELVIGKYRTAALYNTLCQSANYRCRDWITGPYREPIALPSGEPHPLESVYIEPEPGFHERGGRSMVLSDRAALEELPGNAAAGYADGEEIRTVQDKLPMKLLIIDHHTALVPLRPYGHPCLLIRDPGLVTTFATFFDLKWAQGEPWAPPGTQTATKDDTQRLRILEALAEGLKDEAIARRHGISVRTVRRQVTALMQELGVSTRFAAGVAAVRRGWLTRVAATS